MELLQQILTIIATMLGIPAGMIIAGMCKEELKKGRKWFGLISFFSLIAITSAIIIFLIQQTIEILPAGIMVLIILLSLFFYRSSLLFYMSIFTLIIISVLWINLDSFTFLVASFSFIFLISLTAYTASYKKRK